MKEQIKEMDGELERWGGGGAQGACVGRKCVGGQVRDGSDGM